MERAEVDGHDHAALASALGSAHGHDDLHSDRPQQEVKA